MRPNNGNVCIFFFFVLITLKEIYGCQKLSLINVTNTKMHPQSCTHSYVKINISTPHFTNYTHFLIHIFFIIFRSSISLSLQTLFLCHSHHAHISFSKFYPFIPYLPLHPATHFHSCFFCSPFQNLLLLFRFFSIISIYS